MASFKPHTPFNVPMFLFVPTAYKEKGSVKKQYPISGEMIFCSYRTFGGTETTVNGVLSVEDTAVIETWYRPDIKADCMLEDTAGNRFEILGTPENVNGRNQFLAFKIRAIRGGA